MRPRHAWLLALLTLHVAILLAWRPMTYRVSSAGVPRSELVFIMPPPPAAARLTPALPRSAAPRTPPPQQQRIEPAPITLPPAAVSPPPAAVSAPSAEPDPFAQPVPGAADSARGAVAGALQSLRKERPHAFLDRVQSGSAIERALAKAGRGSGTRLEELVLPDGRRMTRVQAGGATYCVVMDSPMGGAGRDVFRDGVQARTVTCPN